jgi:hypothetical protein
VSSNSELTTARVKLVLLLLLLGSPFLAAYVAFYFWKPHGSVNYGELMPTKPVPLAGLEDVSAGAGSAIKDKWVLLTVDSGQCGAACAEKLYVMRQVRATQGKYLERIARAYLIDDNSVPGNELMRQFEGTAVLRASPAALRALPASGDLHAHIYLVDPLNNLVLRYPPKPDTKGMIKDLTRLMAVSKLGN